MNRTRCFGPRCLPVCSSIALLALVLVPRMAGAQCTPLDACTQANGIPGHYQVSVDNPYWSVMGVLPAETDDKDIYVYDSCVNGSLLANSTGTAGVDFVVGDFNHNAYGTVYPFITYGSNAMMYRVSFLEGSRTLPVSAFRNADLGYRTFVPCTAIDVWDVLLQGGTQYEFRIGDTSTGDAYLCLFRNPSSSTYWAGRSGCEFEIHSEMLQSYTAPVTDYYGVVVFPSETDMYNQNYWIEVERMYDCAPMTSGACVSKNVYAPEAPNDNYTFNQANNYWAAVAVVVQPGRDVDLAMYTQCDNLGDFLTSDNRMPDETAVVVADFNHTSPGSYYPVIWGSDPGTGYTIQWSGGAQMAPVPGVISGEVAGGYSGQCGLVNVWDLWLDAGARYGFSFTEAGTADVHVGLFRNPGTGDYWRYSSGGEFLLDDPSSPLVYTAPQSDFYGLVAWSNRRNVSGSYRVYIEPIDDCIALESNVCRAEVRAPGDYSFEQGVNYWSAVGVVPYAEDDKDIAVGNVCDGRGTTLAASARPDGADFVVCDFNHTDPGTYYARVTYGDPTSPYSIQSHAGVSVLPLEELVGGVVGGAACEQIRVWDVYLEYDVEYAVELTSEGEADIRLCFFRNPGNGAYWTNRDGAQFEIPATGTINYIAPASDWYGVVVFVNKPETAGNYGLRIRRLTPTAIEWGPGLPQELSLHPNVPNPFNPVTTLHYALPRPAVVDLAVFDVAGRRVRTLVRGPVPAGEHQTAWDGRDESGRMAASGVYVARLATSDDVATRKIVMLK